MIPLIHKQALFRKAEETDRRKKLLDQANAAYTRLRNDSDSWRQELAERREWDATLMDGLDE